MTGIPGEMLLNGIIIGLATWRLSYAITQEDVFKWLRLLFGVKVIEAPIEEFGHERMITKTVQTADTRLIRAVGSLLSCFYCTSFWIALTLWLVWRNYPDVIWVFAIATIAAMIELWSNKS